MKTGGVLPQKKKKEEKQEEKEKEKDDVYFDRKKGEGKAGAQRIR